MIVHYSSELYHYGILGQKWGIRRYQNYDGTYTQAGLKRYYNSKDNYEKAKSNYNHIKKDKTISRYDKRYAQSKVKEAKRRMDKDYKHLKLDKLGDEGKILYQQGKRITNNRNYAYGIAKAGSAIAIGATIANRFGYIDTKTRNYAALGSLGLSTISEIALAVGEIPNNKLRAYYSHTSNY